jgi:integrase
MKLAKLALKSHARDQAARGVRSGQATPILVDALRTMIDTCDVSTPKGVRDRLVLVLGWSAMLRRSELVGLDLQDVTETGDGLTVYIASSKTDQEAKGDTVLVPRGSHPDSDPVRVLTDWLQVLDHAGVDGGKLLRWIDNGGRIHDSLSGDAVNEIVRSAAKRAGLPGHDGYSAHSLRAGGATATYRNGATVSAIAEHGRWAKNSPVVLGYIRSVDKWKDNPMRGIGL